jgi:hypothetical protein
MAISNGSAIQGTKDEPYAILGKFHLSMLHK